MVKFTLSVRYLKDEPKPKVFAEDAIPCDKCGSIRVIKFGFDCGKQTFYCKDCKHKFRKLSILKKTKFTPDFITLTLDLYFSGLSLRKIARTVANHFNIKVNYSTIYTWIQRYVPMISEYVNSLSPQLSKQWHADELFVRLRGGSHKGRGIGMVWNVMDRDTRYLIVSKLTKDRSAIDTTAAFEEASDNAHGIKPETVFTDSLRHYNIAVRTTFPDATRVENCGIAKRETNNRIERMNGTLRERVKVQRGWKTEKTTLAEGNRIQYNFVKPHMGLDGKTPAQMAGLEVTGWKDLAEHRRIEGVTLKMHRRDTYSMVKHVPTVDAVKKVKTTIDIPEDMWKQFSIKVIQRHGGRKKNDVIQELLQKYIDEDDD